MGVVRPAIGHPAHMLVLLLALPSSAKRPAAAPVEVPVDVPDAPDEVRCEIGAVALWSVSGGGDARTVSPVPSRTEGNATVFAVDRPSGWYEVLGAEPPARVYWWTAPGGVVGCRRTTAIVFWGRTWLDAGPDLRVIDVHPTSDAHRVGLATGDRIDRIDGEPVSADAVARIRRGTLGTSFRLEGAHPDGTAFAVDLPYADLW